MKMNAYKVLAVRAKLFMEYTMFRTYSCFKIPSSLAEDHKILCVRVWSQEGIARVLTVERVCAGSHTYTHTYLFAQLARATDNTASLQRDKTLLTSVLDLTLNNLMVRLY